MSDVPLAPLFEPLTSLRNVGPAQAKLMARVTGGGRIIDLLFRLPESYVDRRTRPSVKQARPGSVVTLTLELVRIEPPGNPRQPHRLVARDETGFIDLLYFNRPPPKFAAAGGSYLVSGQITDFNGRPRINTPEHLVPVDRPGRFPWIDPVWPLTEGLRKWQVAQAMTQALVRLPALPEWHDAALLRREKWPSFGEALRALQCPPELPAGTPFAPQPLRARLAYDELLAGQVALGVVRGRVRARPGRALAGDSHLRDQALQRFGHRPTGSQVQAVAEIDADMAGPRRMLRLLQGDVGSGKTLVALLAMLRAVEAGAQAALMAPTELLSKQHHRTLSELSPVPVGLLTGSVKGRERSHLLRMLASGDLKLVVGTHALFQEAVQYHDLALAVIDEQHRFGVDQRLLLGGKGEMTDVLVMTATPIPRTLLLTQWGEMDVSRLTEKPGGRLPIRTTLHSLGTMNQVLEGIVRQVERGAQVYWVCPLVAESEAVDLAAAEDRFATLRTRFGDRIGLVHGQQTPEVRDAALAAFRAGETRLLVATTVVEVGMDVPQASIMVIEHAERFGLAQLHQLRGRVGRGAEASFCLLLHEDWVNETARRRLTLLRDTDDGFLIADEDFRLRGGGDLLGTRQAGAPGFRLADPVEHEGLLHMADRDATVLLQRDPKLESERGQAIRLLLRLFERTAAMRTLVSG